MSPTREDVVGIVQSAFPEANRKAVVETLDLYGGEPNELERERVHIAILKLCGSDEGKLLHFVAVAKQDYRDVLFWSETPQNSKR
jgi:hypothetical protein